MLLVTDPRALDPIVTAAFMGLPIVRFLSSSRDVYRVVDVCPARHGYPPQVTLHTSRGLPLVVDVVAHDEEHQARAA